jgi:SAM-dependent methyltransferase
MAEINQDKFQQFMGQALHEAGAAFHAALVVVGDKLGLYRALAGTKGLTSAELATKTKTSERYVREWLANQAAGGYLNYDAKTSRYSMSPEAEFALADPTGPDLPGLFLVASAVHRSEEKISEAFKTGKGVGWHEQHHSLFHGTERFFRPGYAMNLIGSWIPALEGVEAKLKKGARVADVGCGHGATTIIMAQAYPKSQFIGFDYHEGSVARAREAAKKAGVDSRVEFEVAAAKQFPGEGYDLVAFFDCLHDMGDPVGAGKHVLKSLKKDGTWMIVEPFAGDATQDNLNPIGRLFYGASTMICTPASLSQEVGLALGAQAGEKRIGEVATKAGFTRFRRAAETPFNLIFEARP